MALKARLGLVLLSAVVLVVCFPPFGAWPLVVMGLVPLLLAMRGATWRQAFCLGLLHGLLLYAGTLHWLRGIFAIATLPLFCILALFTAAFCVLLRTVNRRGWPPYLAVLLTATLWTGLEFYRCEVFLLRFPWISMGSAIPPTYLLPLVGVYGTTFLIVLASAGLFYRETWRVAAGLGIALLALGVVHPRPVELAAGEGLAVTVVQSEEGFLDSYAELTRSEQQNHPDLVLWPEYSLPYDVRQRPWDMDRLKTLCGELDAVLVLGTQTVIGPGTKEWRNTALTMAADGVLGEYYKARPVHFFNDGIAGTTFAPIQTRCGAIGTPVCFDCDNATVVRDMTMRGAEWFAVPIFDAQDWGATQHLQHGALFRLRAAENGRWFACAASSGVSQVIDPHGQVHASLPLMAPGAFTSRVGRRTDFTIYSRVGWLLPWCALLCAVGYSFFAAAVALRKRNLPQTAS
ncbi:MAG: hypothetical protein HN380_21190 [Victivallales bacterium]|nr:hypothetical protein [Victivallales bacterium]